MKEIVWPVDSDNGQYFDVRDIRAELQEKAEEARQYMLESIVETDDVLMEKFFGGEEITKEEIIKERFKFPCLIFNKKFMCCIN